VIGVSCGPWLKRRNSTSTIHLDGHLGLHRQSQRNYTTCADANVPPILLDGPPGIGKSHWARSLGTLLALPVAVVEATGESASFGVVGSQRGWSGAYPGRLIQTVLDSLVGNPLIVVDEIEKAGQPTSTSGITFGLQQALLPLIEPMSARRWSCPYYQVRFDMPWVGWVLTSNSTRPLPRPLLSRLTVLRLPALTIDQLAAFAMTAGRSRGLSDASLSAIAEALRSVTSVAETRPSLRTVMRMLDRAADLENKPRLM
ncbi:AAA family ATPase, partial [Paracoccus sp. S-4012]|uniref:AAA family ATPase n=1 Tax=Paracoccus sp. S-4012 TaxID=2665648 RepID=UPI0012B0BF05